MGQSGFEVRRGAPNRFDLYLEGEKVAQMQVGAQFDPDDVELHQYRPGRFAVYYRKKLLGRTTQGQIDTWIIEYSDWVRLRWDRVRTGRVVLYWTVVAFFAPLAILSCLLRAWALAQQQGVAQDFAYNLWLNLGTELLGASLFFLAFTVLWKLVQSDQQRIEKRIQALLDLREQFAQQPKASSGTEDSVA